ncbi:MAG TPA: tetratricopeptide repeat protein, partial [Candidatus Nitrosocosmicus sp.]|nr:tetratricopeptide repeat protein [Candidatus Nitrosocosmicus sp.]
EVGDKDGISRTLNNMAGVHYNKGDPNQALNLYNQSLNLAKELGDQYGMCQTLNNISAIYHNKGEYGYALYYAIQSYELSKRLNVPEAQRSLAIISSIRDMIGKEDFDILEYSVKREINNLLD